MKAIFSTLLFAGTVLLGSYSMTLTKAVVAQEVSLQESREASAESDADPLSPMDQLLVSVQEICPVTGEPLGSMGTPVKVQVGQQIAFLCCKGCQGKPIDKTHWQSIQTNIAEAQGTCPIMEKPVDASMKSTVVQGQQIFVCCPPCIEKIQKEPKPNLEKVANSYKTHVAVELKLATDEAHIKAQGICPVTGKPLGSMGKPIKVKVGAEQVAFLCCKGCVGKKISAEHWSTIQQNLAAAQKVCLVMGKPVDASMESVVIQGRKIFVCCPPCIEKIQATPAKYLRQWNAQVNENVTETTN